MSDKTTQPEAAIVDETPPEMDANSAAVAAYRHPIEGPPPVVEPQKATPIRKPKEG